MLYPDKVKRRAFTLIELLVVIAILSILAALIFPAFARAKASAKQASCLSNLRQVGASMALYMADYDDLFPRGIDPVDKFRPEIWDAYPEWQVQIPYLPLLHEALQPYIKSRELFHCPSDSGTLCIDNDWPLQLPSSPTLFNTYGTSYFFRTEIAFRQMSQTSIQEVAAINVLFDAAGDWHPGAPKLDPGDSYYNVWKKLKAFRYNTLFADMHVKNISYNTMQAAWSKEL